MIRMVFGIMVGIPLVVFAALTLRPPARTLAHARIRRGIRLILLGGTLMFVALLVQVIFPFGAELHGARIASLATSGIFIAASGICTQAGVFSNFRQARRAASSRSAHSRH
jgi:hypothetical protein